MDNHLFAAARQVPPPAAPRWWQTGVNNNNNNNNNRFSAAPGAEQRGAPPTHLLVDRPPPPPPPTRSPPPPPPPPSAWQLPRPSVPAPPPTEQHEQQRHEQQQQQREATQNFLGIAPETATSSGGSFVTLQFQDWNTPPPPPPPPPSADLSAAAGRGRHKTLPAWMASPPAGQGEDARLEPIVPVSNSSAAVTDMPASKPQPRVKEESDDDSDVQWIPNTSGQGQFDDAGDEVDRKRAALVTTQVARPAAVQVTTAEPQGGRGRHQTLPAWMMAQDPRRAAELVAAAAPLPPLQQWSPPPPFAAAAPSQKKKKAKKKKKKRKDAPFAPPVPFEMNLRSGAAARQSGPPPAEPPPQRQFKWSRAASAAGQNGPSPTEPPQQGTSQLEQNPKKQLPARYNLRGLRAQLQPFVNQNEHPAIRGILSFGGEVPLLHTKKQRKGAALRIKTLSKHLADILMENVHAPGSHWMQTSALQCALQLLRDTPTNEFDVAALDFIMVAESVLLQQWAALVLEEEPRQAEAVSAEQLRNRWVQEFDAQRPRLAAVLAESRAGISSHSQKPFPGNVMWLLSEMRDLLLANAEPYYVVQQRAVALVVNLSVKKARKWLNDAQRGAPTRVANFCRKAKELLQQREQEGAVAIIRDMSEMAKEPFALGPEALGLAGGATEPEVAPEAPKPVDADENRLRALIGSYKNAEKLLMKEGEVGIVMDKHNKAFTTFSKNLASEDAIALLGMASMSDVDRARCRAIAGLVKARAASWAYDLRSTDAASVGMDRSMQLKCFDLYHSVGVSDVEHTGSSLLAVKDCAQQLKNFDATLGPWSSVLQHLLEFVSVFANSKGGDADWKATAVRAECIMTEFVANADTSVSAAADVKGSGVTREEESVALITAASSAQSIGHRQAEATSKYFQEKGNANVQQQADCASTPDREQRKTAAASDTQNQIAEVGASEDTEGKSTPNPISEVLKTRLKEVLMAKKVLLQKKLEISQQVVDANQNREAPDENRPLSPITAVRQLQSSQLDINGISASGPEYLVRFGKDLLADPSANSSGRAMDAEGLATPDFGGGAGMGVETMEMDADDQPNRSRKKRKLELEAKLAKARLKKSRLELQQKSLQVDVSEQGQPQSESKEQEPSLELKSLSKDDLLQRKKVAEYKKSLTHLKHMVSKQEVFLEEQEFLLAATERARKESHEFLAKKKAELQQTRESIQSLEVRKKAVEEVEKKQMMELEEAKKHLAEATK